MALRRWFAVAAQQCPYLRLAEPAVSPRGPDAGNASRGRPAGDGFRIHPEECGHLSRREQALVVAVHVQSPPTVLPRACGSGPAGGAVISSPASRARSGPSSLALNEYFLPRFLEIRSAFRGWLSGKW